MAARAHDTHRPPLGRSASSYEIVDSAVTCVLTRFRMRSVFSLPYFYVLFLRMREPAAEIKGLLKNEFLIGDFRTFYSLSIWKDEKSIRELATLHRHVGACRWAFFQSARVEGRPAIWSVELKLRAVSNNINWDGLDLRDILAQERGVPKDEVAQGPNQISFTS